MKTGIFTLAALAFGGLAAAQPHRSNPRHAGLHEKRDYVTEYDVVTVTAPAVIVHVDGSSTWTETQFSTPTSAPSSESSYVAAPSSAESSEPASYAEAPASTPAPVASEVQVAAVSVARTSSTEEPSSSTQQAASSTQATAAASSAAAGYGMSYNPYTSDGQCKLQDEVNSDIDILSDYTTIRIYGTDCNQTKTVPHAVAQHPGMKLMMGLSNSDLSDVSSAVDLIIAGVNAELNSSWDRIDTVTVGNEAVTGGAASVSDVVSALNSARTKLRNAKPNAYTGPVVTVEQVGAILDSADGSGLQLCQNSDYTAANCHAFFDTSGDYTTGTRAGDFVGMQYERLVKGCGKERTVITESGWPWNTEWPLTDFADTDPIPSTENQEEAMKSLKKLFKSNPQDVVLFSAFDDAWKPNFDGSKGAEGYWGVHHN